MFIVNTHFRTFHLSMLGAELGPKLRQKWADHSISTVGQLKMKRSVQSQIKFLERLQGRINRIIVNYQNANSNLGKLYGGYLRPKKLHKVFPV